MARRAEHWLEKCKEIRARLQAKLKKLTQEHKELKKLADEKDMKLFAYARNVEAKNKTIEKLTMQLIDMGSLARLSSKELEKRHILVVMKYYEGHKSKACKTLGISGATLNDRLRRYEEEKNGSRENNR